MSRESKLLEAYALVGIKVGDKINILTHEEVNPFTLTEAGLRNKNGVASDHMLPLILEWLFWFEEKKIVKMFASKLSDEYIPVDFTEDNFDEEAYPVYKKATRLKNFRFYKRKGEEDRYYLEVFESGRVTEIEGGIVNLENWLRTWIDDLGDVAVTKRDIREAYKEGGIEL